MTVSIQETAVAKLCPVCRELTRHERRCIPCLPRYRREYQSR